MKPVVGAQPVPVIAAGLGPQEGDVAVVFGGGYVAVGRFQFVVEGGRGKVQGLPAHALMAGRYQVHRRVHPGLQVREGQQGVQQLGGTRGE